MRRLYVQGSLFLAAFCIASIGYARDPSVIRQFRAVEPCPSTGALKGACPGWQVDHIVALCLGGADHPANLQWIEVELHKIKTADDVRECRKARLGRAVH